MRVYINPGLASLKPQLCVELAPREFAKAVLTLNNDEWENQFARMTRAECLHFLKTLNEYFKRQDEVYRYTTATVLTVFTKLAVSDCLKQMKLERVALFYLFNRLQNLDGQPTVVSDHECHAAIKSNNVLLQRLLAEKTCKLKSNEVMDVGYWLTLVRCIRICTCVDVASSCVATSTTEGNANIEKNPKTDRSAKAKDSLVDCVKTVVKNVSLSTDDKDMFLDESSFVTSIAKVRISFGKSSKLADFINDVMLLGIGAIPPNIGDEFQLRVNGLKMAESICLLVVISVMSRAWVERYATTIAIPFVQAVINLKKLGQRKRLSLLTSLEKTTQFHDFVAAECVARIAAKLNGINYNDFKNFTIPGLTLRSRWLLLPMLLERLHTEKDNFEMVFGGGDNHSKMTAESTDKFVKAVSHIAQMSFMQYDLYITSAGYPHDIEQRKTNQISVTRFATAEKFGDVLLQHPKVENYQDFKSVKDHQESISAAKKLADTGVISESTKNNLVVQLLAYNTGPFPYKVFLQTQSARNLVSHLEENQAQWSRNKLLCLDVCQNIVKAVSFCHNKNVLIRNMTARSFVVHHNDADTVWIQLANLESARDVSKEFPYTGSDTELMPLLWCDPQSVERCIYTFHTDVYSLVLTIIQVFSCGQSPFGNCCEQTFKDDIAAVTHGNRVPSYNGLLPVELYGFLLKGILKKSARRPSLLEIEDKLSFTRKQVAQDYLMMNVDQMTNAKENRSSRCVMLETPKRHAFREHYELFWNEAIMRWNEDLKGRKGTIGATDGELYFNCQHVEGKNKKYKICIIKNNYDQAELNAIETVGKLGNQHIAKFLEYDRKGTRKCGHEIAILQPCSDRTLLDYARNASSGIKIEQRIEWYSQTLLGMQFLFDRKLIHCNIRGDTLFISDDASNVQLAEFCYMTRVVPRPSQEDPNFVHVKPFEETPDNILRWLPLESLQYRLFSTRSDITMFGRTTWQIEYAMGRHDWHKTALVPYFNVSKEMLLKYIRMNIPLPRLEGTPSWLLDIVDACCRPAEMCRPTTEVIRNALRLREAMALNETNKQTLMGKISSTIIDDCTDCVDIQFSGLINEIPSAIGSKSDLDSPQWSTDSNGYTTLMGASLKTDSPMDVSHSYKLKTRSTEHSELSVKIHAQSADNITVHRAHSVSDLDGYHTESASRRKENLNVKQTGVYDDVVSDRCSRLNRSANTSTAADSGHLHGKSQSLYLNMATMDHLSPEAQLYDDQFIGIEQPDVELMRNYPLQGHHPYSTPSNDEQVKNSIMMKYTNQRLPKIAQSKTARKLLD